MLDTTALREIVERHKTLLQKIDAFCFGNGNKGVDKRLEHIEDIINGNKECIAMKEIRSHLTWHEKMSGRRWELYIGFILVIVAQILSSMFLGG